MRIHRFLGYRYLAENAAQSESIVIQDKELVNQLRKVLKLGIGGKIILGNGRGKEALCRIAGIDKETMRADIVSISRNENEPDRHVVLYCSVLKKENFEWAVQKATELGVREIMPIVTERTIKTRLKEERIIKIIKEAAEQSARGHIPLLHPPGRLYEAIADAEKNDSNIIFDLGSSFFNQKIISRKARLGLFIGPEGGWSPEEKQIFPETFARAGLGKLVLRAETAAAAACFLACQGENF